MGDKNHFEYPSSWDNEEIMYDLFQDLKRPENIDPQNYNEKYSFWEEIIIDYLRKSRVVVFTERSIRDKFKKYFQQEKRYLEPQCLPVILSKMIDRNLIQTSTNLFTKSIEFTKSIFSYIYSWVSFSEIGTPLSYKGPDQILYIEEVLIEESLAFFNKFLDFIEDKRISVHFSVVEESIFNTFFNDFFKHHETRNFIRKYLFESKKCLESININLSDSSSIKVVRVSNSFDVRLPKQSKALLAKIAAISKLRFAHKQIKKTEEMYEIEFDELIEKAKSHFQNKEVKKAKNFFKKAKILEKHIDDKRQALHNVEQQLLVVDSTEDNQIMIAALKSTLKTIKLSNKSVLSLDQVDSLMNELADSAGDASDIGQEIAKNTAASVDLSEEDLEHELSNLTLEKILPNINDTKLEREPTLTEKQEVLAFLPQQS